MKYGHWILDAEHRTVEVDLLTWADWLEGNERCVGYTELAGGIVTVSTMFLGIDHNWSSKGPPILFETMVLGLDAEDIGGMMWRYSSWDDAETGHAATVKKVAAMLAKTKTPEIKAKKKTE